MPEFTPSDWYWLSTDGRVFSSAQEALIAPEDESFRRWLADGCQPTPWPRDADGAETIAALQEVLQPYGLFVDLKAYARNISWQKRVAGVPIGGLHVASDPDSLTLITGMVSAAQLDPTRSFNFDTAAGPILMTAEQGIAFGVDVLNFVQSTFDRRAEVLAKIDAGEITTKGDVDAAFADI